MIKVFLQPIKSNKTKLERSTNLSNYLLNVMKYNFILWQRPLFDKLK